jgi:hypothetical protein
VRNQLDADDHGAVGLSDATTSRTVNEQLPAPLTNLSPWLDVRLSTRRDVLADLEKQTHRRFIKTHTARWGLPIADGVMYICVGRDPRDVALSWDDHLANADPEVTGAKMVAAAAIDSVDLPRLPDPPPVDLDQSVPAKFWQWIFDDTPPTTVLSSLLSTLDHVQSFWAVRDAGNTVLVQPGSTSVQTPIPKAPCLVTGWSRGAPYPRWRALLQVASTSVNNVASSSRPRSLPRSVH